MKKSFLISLNFIEKKKTSKCLAYILNWNKKSIKEKCTCGERGEQKSQNISFRLCLYIITK